MIDERKWLAEQFETCRPHLQAVAYRMLGSLSEADDAVQTSWLRLNRADTSGVENLGGWLTTVVARVCLDMLRARKSRREESLDTHLPEPSASREDGGDPEREALLADSVGLALLVILDTLEPAERLAFVLHDLFALPFEEIAPIVERSPTAARQLASRARRRVRGAAVPTPELTRQRTVVEAFLAAARAGDFEGLLAVLDPDVMIRADAATMPSGVAWETHGARVVTKLFGRPGGAQGAQPALVNGAVGYVVASHGRLVLVVKVAITDGKIVLLDVVADPAHLRQIELAVL